MRRPLRALLRAAAPPPAAPTAAQVAAALARLTPFEDGSGDDERPIFVLGTGWRTGSTLLQRVLVTDPRLLLWGEPLGRFAILPRLAEAVCGMVPGWPPAEFWIDHRPAGEALATSWIANLFPPAADFRAALRQLCERWLARPARERGYSRWGLKEVRLGAAEAVLLRWLFPRACFVVLTRDPAAAYRSIKGSSPDWWVYARWPDQRVDCVTRFARHWDRLAASWQEPAGVTPAVLRYEEIAAGGFDFRPLADALELDLSPDVALAARTGATGHPLPLTRLERLLVDRQTAAGRRAMGYSSR